MRRNFIVFGLVLVATIAQAQSVLSPYTINGIGEISPVSVAQNSAKGDAGVSLADVWHINVQNPAALVANTLTTFQMGVIGDFRTIANETSSERNQSGSLRYLAMSFPIVRGSYTTSIGLLPYSSVNYNIVQQQVVGGSSAVATFNYVGEGGLSQAYWAHGIKILPGLAFGVKGSYIFGAVDNEIITSLSNENTFRTALIESTSYSDFNFSAGLYFRHKVKDETFLNFGLTHDLSANLTGERFARLERRDFGSRVTPVDTVINAQQSQFSLPTSFAVGLTLEKTNKYAISAEASIQQWDENSGFENDNTSFTQAIRLALGGQLTPDPADVSSYLKRVTYRAGFSYELSPYLVNGQEITDFGINFGWSLPVSRASTFDMAFKIGQRGTLENDLIRERYFKFTIGATVNDRWFVRRKYD